MDLLPTFLFSCLSFMNMRCLRCLFLISDTLKLGGKAVAAGSLFSIVSTFCSAPPPSPFPSLLTPLFFDFFFFPFVSWVSGTSVKSIVCQFSVLPLFRLTCIPDCSFLRSQCFTGSHQVLVVKEAVGTPAGEEVTKVPSGKSTGNEPYAK